MKFTDSSAQDFALAAKSVRMSKLSREGICPSPIGVERRHLEWTDSVTVKPKAELFTEFGRIEQVSIAIRAK